MAAHKKHDWETIRNEYVIGYRRLNPSSGLEEVLYPTYKELAEKYGIDEGYVKTRGSKERWLDARETLKERLKFKTLKEAVSGELSESAQFDARILWNANRLLAVVEAFFEQYEYIQLGADGNFHFIKDNAGYSEDEPDPIKNIKVSDLKGLVDVLEKTQSLVRRTLGEPINASTNKGQLDPRLKADLTKEDVDRLVAQRDTLMRQLDGKQYEVEQIRAQLDELEK